MVILYVDDDPEDIEIFIEALKANDSSIKCVVAHHGKEAMDILDSGLLPDLIFLDINMPVISGKAILAEIRKHKMLEAIPVIMYSTSVNQAEASEYLRIGANRFLIKPNRFQDLCDAVSEILQPRDSGRG